MLSNFRFSLAKSRLFNFKSSRRLSLMRGYLKGKRCFVIGNGPSLRISDLNRIKRNGDFTIASNKIYLAFGETRWEAEYIYCC